MMDGRDEPRGNQRSGLEVVLDLRRTGEAWPRGEFVGNTSLVRSRKLEHLFKEEFAQRGDPRFQGQIFLKLEGENRTGSHKDRPQWAHVKECVQRNQNEVTIASCGNAAEALAVSAFQMGLKCTIFMSRESAPKKIIRRIEECGGTVILVDGDYDVAVAASMQYASENSSVYDANSKGPNNHIEKRAYSAIATEIQEQLVEKKKAVRGPLTGVAMPVGNASLLVGVHQGFAQLRERGVIENTPVFIGGTDAASNPIFDAWRHDLKCVEPIVGEVRVTCSNSALATRQPSDAEAALGILRKPLGWAANVSEVDLNTAYSWVRQERSAKREIRALKPGVAGVYALFESLRNNPKLPRDGVYAVVITGEED